MNTIWNSLYVQADHPLVTATQIADHEAFHAKANRNGAEMIDKLAERIASMDKDAFDRVVDKYAKALETIYDASDYDAFMRIVAEEMLADAYSGINAFGAHAEQFGDTVNQWMDEHFIGKKSEAEMEQLRGPPEGQRFSVDDSSFANAEEAKKAKSIIQQLNDNLDRIMQMEPVATIDRANATPYANEDSIDWTAGGEVFDAQGGAAYRRGVGVVHLSHNGAVSTVKHGNGPAKQASFPAIKAVIEKGIEVQRDIKHKGKEIDTITVAAPVDFFGDKVALAAVIKEPRQNRKDRGFYVHELCDSNGGFVILQYKNEAPDRGLLTAPADAPHAANRMEEVEKDFRNENIQQPAEEVKQNFSVDDAEYLRLAENPAQNYDRLNEMVRQAAEDAGYTDEVNHGTKAFGFTVIDTNASDDKLSFFASKHRDTAQTYSGETSRDSIGKDRHVNYAELYDLNENQYLDEVRKLFPDVKYATDDDLAPRIENINRAFDTDMEMLYLSSYVFDSPEETAQVQKLVDAVRGMKTATNSEQLEAAISDFHAALDDTRKQFGDELYSDLLDAVKMTREAYQAKEEVFDYDWLSIGENAKMPILISRNKMTEMLVAEGNKGIYRLYANTSGMLAISGHGASWHAIRSNIEGLPEHSSTRAIAKWAFDHGYRGVIYNDIYDAGSAKYKDVGTDTVYAFFDPQTQLKSADIVTYDDNGQIIPLSERFNAANDDIRFSADDSQAQERNQEQAKAEGGSRNGSAVRPEVKATYAKNNLRAKVQTIFSIQPGNRSVANDMINDVTDRYLRNGYISEDDRQNFFDRLVEMGTVTVPAEESYREAREYLRGGRIYVEPSVVADFGDDWADKNMRDFYIDFQMEK